MPNFDELIEQLEFTAALIEWDYSLGYVLKIQEVIEILKEVKKEWE